MKILFLVFSPFQMLNAIEARYSICEDDDECHLVYFRGVSPKNASQIKCMINSGDWTSVHHIPQEESFWSIRGIAKQTEEIWNSIECIDQICLGSFSAPLGRHLANKFKPKEVVVLDDGTATHRIYEYRFDDVFPAGGEERPNKNLVYLKKLAKRFFLGVDVSVFDKVKFFSIYRNRVHPVDTYIANDYSYLRTKLSLIKNVNEVHFLGGCLSELGIVSEEFYMTALRGVNEIYSDKRFVYFPHRRESDQKLLAVEKLPNVEVRRLDTPYELDILNNGEIPREIISFYTTALDSCSILLGGYPVSIRAYKIPETEIVGCEQRRFIKSVYDYYLAVGDVNVDPIAL